MYTVKPFSPSTLPKYCHCILSLSPSLSLSLSQFKERRKKRKRKKERYLYLVLSAGNIARTLNMCLCPHVLKTLLYFKMSPRVETYSLCCLPVELPSFAYSLSASMSPQFILAKCLIRLLKYYTENWNCRLQIIILYLNLDAHIFHYPRGRKMKWSGGCV